MILANQPTTFVIAIKEHPISESQLNDCLASAKKFNWKINVFWGVDGRTINDSIWTDQGIFPRLDKPTMSRPGVQGCFLSHWYLWQKCVKLGEPIIILEHDAVIQGKWQTLELNDSIIKLHRYYKQKKPKYDNDTGLWSASGHAYCLSPDHANTLIEFVKNKGAFEVDRIIGDKVISYKHLGKPSLIERQNLFSTTEKI